MKIPLIYNIRSLKQRPVSTLSSVLGVTIVVGVFCGMLALATGFQNAIVATGSPENVLVLRAGADALVLPATRDWSHAHGSGDLHFPTGWRHPRRYLSE